MLNHPYLESELRERHQELLREARQRRLLKLAQMSRQPSAMRAWLTRIVAVFNRRRLVPPAPTACPAPLELEKMRTLL